MAVQNTVKDIYQNRYDQHNSRLQQLLKIRNRLGWLRLGVVIATIIMAIQGFTSGPLIGVFVILAGLAVFLFLVSTDVSNKNHIAHLQRLLSINKTELNVLVGNYHSYFDGTIFQPQHHAHAGDLDLFGHASLFQYTNRCSSEQGRSVLSKNFLEGLRVDDIEKRQEAVKELAPQLDWRQHLQALLLHTPVTSKTEQKIEQWLAEEDQHFTHPAWPYVIEIYSLLTIASAVAALTGLMAPALFSGLFFVYLFIATALSQKATKAYMHLSNIVKEIGTLQQGMQALEEKTVHSPLLILLQQSVKSSTGTAHGEMKKLKDLLNRFDMRLNVYVFLFLNSFLLWDVRQMIGLNRWRRENGPQVKKWFAALAELEVLNSLATLHFNQPEWAWPQFTEDHFTFDGIAVGHPLILPSQRITNDFRLRGTAKTALITGSNMAGKSTFLRSLGVNTVLAQAGAPVCAKQLTLSPVKLMSSMRIADNLAENTSTFYAELKKLKGIIEAIKQHQPLFILLDEVLRGTNSLDRHIGSKALIRQILKEQAVAVIATHDVEIARLEDEYPNSIENFHFDVQVAGEELYFDYKLKKGVCTSLNASLLMKKIGIELDET